MEALKLINLYSGRNDSNIIQLNTEYTRFHNLFKCEKTNYALRRECLMVS